MNTTTFYSYGHFYCHHHCHGDASSFSYVNSKIIPGSKSITSTEPILIPFLSTENIEIILHGAQYSRLRKTNIISHNKLSYKYLDVCVHQSYYETIEEKNDKDSKNEEDKLNPERKNDGK